MLVRGTRLGFEEYHQQRAGHGERSGRGAAAPPSPALLEMSAGDLAFPGNQRQRERERMASGRMEGEGWIQDSLAPAPTTPHTEAKRVMTPSQPVSTEVSGIQG